jgi:hypothetical protein
LPEVQRVGLATGLTALAGHLGVFDGADTPVRDYVDEQQAEVAGRIARFRDVAPRVTGLLAAAELMAVPVKGAVLAGVLGDEPVWPQPETRPMSDLDLLVPPRYRAQSGAVLLRGGWVLHASSAHEDTFLVWGDGSVGRTDGESAAHNGRVEVHPGWTEFLHGYVAHGFDLEHRAHRRADGTWRLDDPAFVAHVVGHLASTVVRAEVRAVNVLDVWFLAARGIDWHAVDRCLHDIAPQLTAPGLWIADRFLPGVVPPVLLQRELGRLGKGGDLLGRTPEAAVLRDPTQRTTASWRAAFARTTTQRAAVARQLASGAVGRVR